MAKAHCMVVARDPTTGATLLSATCNVYTPGTVTPIPATMFDKNNNVLTNPLTSDAVTGLIDFYLNVAQEVDLVISKAGFTTRTYSNVPVLDDASLDLSALLTTTGDTPYASAANTPARLPIGAQGTFLNVGGGSIPRWGNTIDAGGLTVTAGGLTVTAGNVGVGGAPGAAIGLNQTSTLTGATQQGLVAQPTYTMSGTTTAEGIAIPANSTAQGASTKRGIHVYAQTGANAANYGIQIDAPSGATTNVGVQNLGGAAVNGASTNLGFFSNAAPTQAQQTITGSRSANAALASLLTALANHGLIIDSSTA